jgi:magnesium transporter
LQDVMDQHLKMQALCNQVLDDVTNLMNLNFSYSSQRINEVMKILTMFSVFFMPLTFIAGIYGMNFEYMPELTKKWGYPAVLILMMVIAVVIYQWFKKKKWI